MIVKEIELKNFRNYKALDLSFDEHINILYGDNAQGKTNILESIYMCSTTKSHRSNKDVELINFDKKEGHIKLHIEKGGKSYRIDVHLKKNKSKGIAINGIPIKKASDLFGVFNVIFFSPEDLSIIKSGPSERRRFLDIELCQLDKIYVHNLINYNKILNQRNKLLKDIYNNSSLIDTLDVWDMQLASYGREIISRRQKFVEDINLILEPIHRKITNGEKIKIEYNNNCEEDLIYDNLLKNRERDLKYKVTSVGPHRDDMSFISNDINLRTYGSQGQQRTAALSLKLSEIELVKKQIGDTPVLLLDDVMSELDSSRQKHLLESLDDIQTIITCTGLDDFVANRFSMDKIYQVDNGKVSEFKN